MKILCVLRSVLLLMRSKVSISLKAVCVCIYKLGHENLVTLYNKVHWVTLLNVFTNMN